MIDETKIITAEQKASDVQLRNKLTARAKRNDALASCDWTQNRDVALSNDAEWQTYRQALRDVTGDAGWAIDPITVVDAIIATRPI